MDYQNRAGSKFGGGGVASQSATNADRRERLRKLALETIDLEKDPYFFKNHVGSFECRLCLTVHQNDGSYLAHTQGRKHQTNLARRAAREAKEGQAKDGANILTLSSLPKKTFIPVGTPKYRVQKIRDPLTRQLGLLCQISYPQIASGVRPHYRWMSAHEQKQEEPDKDYMWLIIAAEPYQTIGFKLQKKDVDMRSDKSIEWFDPDSKDYWLQIIFKSERDQRLSNVPGLAPGAKT